MGFFSGDDKKVLTQGFFESKEAFARRVVKEGNRVAGSQGANARATLRRMEDDKRKREQRKAADERARKEREAKRKKEARLSVEALKRRQQDKQPKNRAGDSWW